MALCVMGVASRAEYNLVLYRMASATHTCISLESVVIPTKPHQPLSFNFPRGHLGMERSFQPSWFAKWPFFIMMNQKTVFCHTCLMGFKLKRMKTSMRADPAFVSSIAS